MPFGEIFLNVNKPGTDLQKISNQISVQSVEVLFKLSWVFTDESETYTCKGLTLKTNCEICVGQVLELKKNIQDICSHYFPLDIHLRSAMSVHIVVKSVFWII